VNPALQTNPRDAISSGGNPVSATGLGTRRRRIVAAASAAAIALVGVAVVAPSAEAKPAPRTFTSTISPTTAQSGAQTNYQLTVTNTSGKVPALTQLQVSIPAVFVDVTSGSISSPRGGWSQTWNSSTRLLTASTGQPARGLKGGESLTLGLSATFDGDPCAGTSEPWIVSTDGNVQDGYTLQGTQPIVTVSGIAAVNGQCSALRGQPNVPLADLLVAGGSTTLTRGASGWVSLAVQNCEDAEFCEKGTELELLGNFKGLYSAEAPATISRICSASDCPHVSYLGESEAEGGDTYDYNHNCQFGCAGYGTPFGEREVEEDFKNYPTYVSINGDEFKLAGRCVPVSDLTTTGKILTTKPGSQAPVDFCVDVNAMDREYNSFDGALTIPVLFVEDIKLRP
jgi:hypothetical protein